MLTFNPTFHENVIIPYGPEQKAIDLVFTAQDDDLEHLELWTDLPDGDGKWKAIPFILEAPEAPKETGGATVELMGEDVIIKSTLEPLPATSTAPADPQAVARTTIDAASKTFSYTFRRSWEGRVEWLGGMGENGTLIIEAGPVSEGSVFHRALNDVVEITHENLDGVRAAGIYITDGVPEFKYLPSTHASPALILLEPAHPTQKVYSYVPSSSWQSAVACAASSSTAKLAASPSLDFASCLQRLDCKTDFIPQKVTSPPSTFALVHGKHLLIYDPAPAPNAVIQIETGSKQPVAVFHPDSKVPTFFTGDVRLRQASGVASGPLGAVLTMLQAERLGRTLLCAPDATAVRRIHTSEAVELPTTVNAMHQPDAPLSFWARLAQSFKTFWTVYVLGLFFKQGSSVDEPVKDATTTDEDDDQTVVGERTPLLRDSSPRKPAMTARTTDTPIQSLAFSFSHGPPFAMAITNPNEVMQLRFEADGHDLSVSMVDGWGPNENSSAVLLELAGGPESKGTEREVIIRPW